MLWIVTSIKNEMIYISQKTNKGKIIRYYIFWEIKRRTTDMIYIMSWEHVLFTTKKKDQNMIHGML